MNLQDKVIVITGGTSGLGLATAQYLLHQGATVALLDLNVDELDEDLIASPHVYAFAVNVCDEVQVAQALDQVVTDCQKIDVVVNCAGIAGAARTVGKQGAMPLNDFSKIIQVNLMGSFNVARLAAERMQHNTPNVDGERGLIVFTASVAAYDGQVGQTAYAASKGGIVSLTLPMARDLASIGIRINTIAPGIFNTPMMQSMPDQVKQPLIDMTQFPKRLGHPEEYGKLVAHMIENRFLNGEVIRLDGAIRMQPK